MRSRKLLLVAALWSCAEPSRPPAGVAKQAVDDAPCTFDAPEGWVDVAPPSGSVRRVEEAFARENVRWKSWLELREDGSGSLAEGVVQAKAHEQSALADRLEVEAVRDQPIPDARMSGHLIGYRYRAAEAGPVVIRLHAVYSTGFRTVHLTGESQVTMIDSWHVPNKEAGLHEPWMRRAMQTVRCSR